MIRPAVEIAEIDPASAPARAALAAYYAELDRRFSHGFDPGLSRDPDAAQMRRPVGAFLVAQDGTRPMGCVGLKGGLDYAEVKRLWVDPDLRGAGLGQALMAQLEAVAVALSVRCLRLDTNRALPEAVTFYRRAGWTEIARFNDDPYAHFFFEKRL